MKSQATAEPNKRIWLSGGIATLIAAAVGLVLLCRVGGGVIRLSYDLPFALRADMAAKDVALIYLDEVSHKELKQPGAAPWDRSLHARLIERLTAAGARAIVFDILFSGPSANPAGDASLEKAIKQSGRVILVADYHHGETEEAAMAQWEELPYEPLLGAASTWGNDNFLKDPDLGIRSFFPSIGEVAGFTNVASLPLAVARFIAPANAVHQEQGIAEGWLNYYGPPGILPGVSYFEALDEGLTASAFFKDKIVFIGGHYSADFSGKGKDEFRTPYAYWGKDWAPGVEIQATAALNLIHGNWLSRSPPFVEVVGVITIGILAGFGLMRLHPLGATFSALAVIIIIAVIAHASAWSLRFWFPWLIPILQIISALFCSVVINSLRLYVEKRLLEQSLAAHLSPKLVKRLIADPALRRVGGTQQEVSILFTDIANFSRISETIHSDDLVRMMNKYFEAALQCIHETDGTVVKLMGDAIFAIWNAPFDQEDHRERACRTALRLRENIVEFDVAHLSVPLRTRVGVHAGEACVGNIGSSNRFDYTALGDNINLASRLEGLNKFLGTSVLVTRDVQKVLDKSLVWRMAGHFQFKGLGRVAEVYELVGSPEKEAATREWREQFIQALHEFRLRHFDSAEQKFQRTIDLRRAVEPEYTVGTATITADGPSRFYLDRIAEFRRQAPPREWIGEIELKEK